MDTIKNLSPLFQAILAFVAIITSLGLIFKLLLEPIKKDISRIDGKLKAGLAKLEAKIDKILAKS